MILLQLPHAPPNLLWMTWRQVTADARCSRSGSMSANATKHIFARLLKDSQSTVWGGLRRFIRSLNWIPF